MEASCLQMMPSEFLFSTSCSNKETRIGSLVWRRSKWIPRNTSEDTMPPQVTCYGSQMQVKINQTKVKKSQYIQINVQNSKTYFSVNQCRLQDEVYPSKRLFLNNLSLFQEHCATFLTCSERTQGWRISIGNLGSFLGHRPWRGAWVAFYPMPAASQVNKMAGGRHRNKALLCTWQFPLAWNFWVQSSLPSCTVHSLQVACEGGGRQHPVPDGSLTIAENCWVQSSFPSLTAQNFQEVYKGGRLCPAPAVPS